MVRCDVVLKNVIGLRKILQCIALIFLIIFIGLMVAGSPMNFMEGHYVKNYLSIYTNAHVLLSRSEIPMWSSNFFLGDNFLGAQNVYSIFNPFFLVTLFFQSSVLPKLYFPLLFLKTMLATWALYLYMKETHWFKPYTIVIACILYLFNGWYLSNFTEFVTIELLVFVPFVLYGVEKLITSGRKRYLVASFSIMLISHFTFTLLFLGFLIGYILIRLYISGVDVRDRVRQLFQASGLIIGVNMIVILPLLLALNAVSIELQEGMTLSSLLLFCIRGLFPPLNDSLNEPLSIFSVDVSIVSLYQSILVLLMLPQAIRGMDKKVRRIVLFSYGINLFTVFITQSLELVNITSLAPLNTNVISVLLVLFNSLIVAYSLNEPEKINSHLLNATCKVVKWGMGGLLAAVLVFEIYLRKDWVSNGIFVELWRQFVILSPYFMMFLVIILLIRVYRFILLKVSKRDLSLGVQAITVVLIVECASVSYAYFATDINGSYFAPQYMTNQDSIGNKTYAVADYLQTMDSDFYRVINSYEVQYNEPLYQNYNGFSIDNPYLIASSQDVSWMLDEKVSESLSISTMDYMLTTALSAKYYFTPDYEVPLPGYQYYDRIEGITIFQNNYFLPVGTSSPFYMLKSDFNKLNRDQQHYVFLKAIILDDENLASKYHLQRLDVSDIENNPGEVQYFEAARIRQELGVENVRHSQNKITHDYAIQEPRLLTYSIPYNKGWKAYANGVRIPIYEVNNGFIGIGLSEAGMYEVELVYSSPGVVLGGVVSSITILIILSTFSYRYSRRLKIVSR